MRFAWTGPRPWWWRLGRLAVALAVVMVWPTALGDEGASPWIDEAGAVGHRPAGWAMTEADDPVAATAEPLTVDAAAGAAGDWAMSQPARAAVDGPDWPLGRGSGVDDHPATLPTAPATATAPPVGLTAVPPAPPAPPAPPVSPTPPGPSPVSAGRGRVPILMYHYVREPPDPADRIGVGLSVRPAVFAAQMDYLARHGYHPVTLTHLHQALRGEAELPPRPIVLTFDDGYLDFYEAAWPILRRHGFTSTLFVITGKVDQPGYLSRQMVIELGRSGRVEIGSHTVSHADLTLVSATRLQREVVESRRTLEAWVGQPITSFCYPAGRYHAGVARAVGAAGYRVAVTTQPGADHRVEAALEWTRVRVSGPGSVAGLATALGQ